MKQFLAYIENIWLDNHGETSGKRILGILCIVSGTVLTSICTLAYLIFLRSRIDSAKAMDLPQLAMLIAPLFATGLALWGITSYFSPRKDNTNTTDNQQP